MLINNQIVPHYVMIKQVHRTRTDRDTKKSTNTNTSTTSKSLYQDERSRLQQLIMMSMQNPSHIDDYVTKFLEQKRALSTSFLKNGKRNRVSSQPILNSRPRKTLPKVLQNPLISRRQSGLARVNTSPKTPSKTPSTNAKGNSFTSEQLEKKKKQFNTPISKLSTSALIDYHKNLVFKAQKLINSNKKQ